MSITSDNDSPDVSVSALANQTRFRILTANFAVTVICVALLTVVVPFIVDLRMADIVSFAPFLITVVAIAGTTQILLNERDMKQMVYFSHPDDPDARQLEPIYWLMIKIGMYLSVIGIVFAPVILWVYDVTVLDLYRMGISGIVNFMLANTAAAIVLGAGLFIHARFEREAALKAPEARKHVNPAQIQHLADNFAIRAATVSLSLWVFGAIFSALVAHSILKWGNFFALFVLVITMGIGIVVFPIQYFIFRRIFSPLRQRVLQSLSRTFEVASLSEVSDLMSEGVLSRGRNLLVLRLAGGIVSTTIFFIFGRSIPPHIFWIGVAYTACVLFCMAMTYGNARVAAVSEYLRIAADGLALILLIQFAGSMTTPGPGIFFLIVFSVCLHRSFEMAIITAGFFAALYGTTLFLEFAGYLPYAPYIPNNLLLDTILNNGVWAASPPVALFALNFAIVTGGMLLAAVLGRYYRRLYRLDRSEPDDILDRLG